MPPCTAAIGDTLKGLDAIFNAVDGARKALNLKRVAVSTYWHNGHFHVTVSGPTGPVQTSGETPDETIWMALATLQFEATQQNIDLPSWLAARRAERAEAERLDRMVAGVDCWDGFGADAMTSEVA